MQTDVLQDDLVGHRLQSERLDVRAARRRRESFDKVRFMI